jgi:hypothetical protein
MWAYKYVHKDTKLEVPRFRTFFYQNQDLLKLWYEDESEPVEDRVSFSMRCLKYIAHLCILCIILFALISPEDAEFHKECYKR